MTTILATRNSFQSGADCQIVSAEQFISHLTSHSHWVRADEPSANLLGLRDQITGSRVYVPLEVLSKRMFTPV